MPSRKPGNWERWNSRRKVGAEHGVAKDCARLIDQRPDGRACARRLQSMGYQTHRHLGQRDGWHAFETDRGAVAIKRHLDGKWEIRRRPAERKD